MTRVGSLFDRMLGFFYQRSESISSKFLLALIAVPAFVLILIVRIIKPVCLVRFGILNSAGLGHFSCNTELFFCKRDLEPKSFRLKIDILSRTTLICNQQLMEMWNRTFKDYRTVLVVTGKFWEVVCRVNEICPGSKDHLSPICSDQDIDGIMGKIPSHLSFNADEDTKGQLGLSKLGLPSKAPYVCFFARDSLYLGSLLRKGDWSYHDYRNVNIENYLHAAKTLARRGVYSLRMGSMVAAPLYTDSPKIIDYANVGRSDFMDIYIPSQCRFLFGTASGPVHVAAIFRKPVAFTDLIPIEYAAFGVQDLFIPKKLRRRGESDFLTFEKIYLSGAGKFLRSEQYEALDLEIVDNTPEEIAELVVEMDERLNGTWVTTEEDNILQERFWVQFRRHVGFGSYARIGANFLRAHRTLLD